MFSFFLKNNLAKPLYLRYDEKRKGGIFKVKSNIIKYIFAVVVIGLLITSAYLIYGKKEENTGYLETKQIEEAPIITTLRIPIVEFDSINPIVSKNQNIQDIARLVYEPLLNVSPEGKITLCLAKEWTKQSATSYVIKLKENIKWQDGQTLYAKDIQYTVDRLKDSNVQSIYSYQVKDVNSLEVIDDYTVKINLNREVPFFEYNLTFPIMSFRYYENENFVNTSKNDHPVGTGRFKVTNENGNLILKQNQNWWNLQNEQTKLTQIELIKYANMGDVYNAFKIGNIDLLTTQTINLEEYIGTIGYNQKQYTGNSLDYLAFNCENKILANVEVRKAISYLINKENIVSGIYKGKYKIANFALDFGSYIYENGRIAYTFDTQKAKELLEQNSWIYSKKIWQKTKDYKTQKIRLNLVVNTDHTKRVEVAENIKNTLEDFGMDISIKKVSDSQYQNYLQNKNYDMILTGVYTGFSPDVTTYFGEGNLANYENEEIKQILNEINNIQDEKLQKEKYERIIQLYEEQMPYIFLYQSQNILAYSSKLLGDINPNRYNIYEGIGSWYRQ